jgi:hypothetical protein
MTANASAKLANTFMKPSIGRIVHFVQSSPDSELVHIPAVIVKVWSETCVNLQVFTDGFNSKATGNACCK